MLLCKVVGHVVATCKQDRLTGKKLLIVQERQHLGTQRTLLAVDCVDAGIGDIVIVTHEGGSSRQASACPQGAVDAAVVGVVDHA